MVPRCLSPLGLIRWSTRIGWTWPTISSGCWKQAASLTTCPYPGPSPEPALMLSAGLSSGRLVRGVGKGKDRPIMSPTPTTIIIMKGRSMGLMKNNMRRMTTVITIAVLTGRTDAPHHPSGLVTRGVIQ